MAKVRYQTWYGNLLPSDEQISTTQLRRFDTEYTWPNHKPRGAKHIHTRELNIARKRLGYVKDETVETDGEFPQRISYVLIRVQGITYTDIIITEY